jgi:hypothetical protein
MTMATTQTSDSGGTNAAIIILAVIIIAAIAVGAVWYMNTSGVSNTNTTTERYVSKVEQVPAQVGQAAKDASTPTVNPPSQDTAPATGATDAPTPNPAPAQ